MMPNNDYNLPLEMTVDFWVGGNLANESDGWRWIDDAAVDMGTPFWAVR